MISFFHVFHFLFLYDVLRLKPAAHCRMANKHPRPMTQLPLIFLTMKNTYFKRCSTGGIESRTVGDTDLRWF